MRPVTVVCACVLACGALAAQAPPPQKKPETPARTGYFKTQFAERHPLGTQKELGKRFGWTRRFVAANDPNGGKYDITKESFQVYVPKSYRPEEPHGLLVWISPGPDGGIFPSWPPALDAAKLIVAGAHDAGNQRLIWYRLALALDAVHNITRRYEIDPERVYVTGFSGGGRAASRLGFGYADVFQGGIYQGGCGYFRRLKVPGDPKREWPPRFPAPKGKVYRLAKNDSRHVLIAGEKDPNALQSKAIHHQLTKRDRFAHVTWMEIPDLGHTAADATWLAKAVAFLDAPSRRK